MSPAAITQTAVNYQDVLRALDALAPTAIADVAQIAKAGAKRPSNLKRDLPRLVADDLVVTDPALAITPHGREVLALLDGRTAFAPDAAHPRAGRDPGDQTPAQAGLERYAGILHALIVPDTLNPRKAFDDEALDDLAATILSDGLLQNLVVRPLAPMEGFGQDVHRLVAGERRWRAVGKLITRGDWPADRPVPCLIVPMDDQTHEIVALIENLQRFELSPLEEARGFQRLVDHGLKTADIAGRINMTQRLVQQRLQLLDLDTDDQEALAAGEISIEQARQRLARPKPETVALTDKELFVMAEVVHKWKHAKFGGGYYAQTEIAHGVKDPVLERLKDLGFVYIRRNIGGNERTYIERSYHWPDKLELPAIPEGTAIYRTSWLNGPFAIPAEGLKRLAEKRESVAKTKAANKLAKEKAEKLAADVAALTRQPLPLPEIGAKAFGLLMARAGSGWPWTISGKDEVKAEGKEWGLGVNLYGVDPSLKRLLTFAVNAAGADQTQGRPPTVTCNHIIGLRILDTLIIKAMFELLFGDGSNAASLADVAGVDEADVLTFRARILGEDRPADEAAMPGFLKRLAGAAD